VVFKWTLWANSVVKPVNCFVPICVQAELLKNKDINLMMKQTAFLHFQDKSSNLQKHKWIIDMYQKPSSKT